MMKKKEKIYEFSLIISLELLITQSVGGGGWSSLCRTNDLC